MEKSRTLMERILAALMCLIMLVGLLPASVISVHAAQTDAFGTVTTKPEDLSVNAEDPANVTVTNDKVVTLTKEKADDSIGRVEGWYVGVEITAPADYAGGATLDCDRPEGHPNGDSKDLSFDDSADEAGGKVVTLWALITEDWIEKGDIGYVLTLDWDNDGTDDQTVTLTVDADKVVLLDAEGEQVYPKAYGTIVTLPEDLAVEDSNPAAITVTNDTVISLTKHEADATIGRLEGWYVGVKIVAPVGYAGGATLDLTRPADHPNGNSTDLDFDANVDVAGVPELTVWALITKEWIEAGDITYVCALDWNHDGTNDQTVTLTVDADKIILLDGEDNRVYPDAFATVVSTPTGVVSGKEDMVVLVKDATIKYDVDKEGWFVFATVTGPAHTEEAKLDGSSIELVSTYELELQPIRNNNGTYTYTGISGSISGVFTWDGVTQKITLQVENATLERLEQTKPEFEKGLEPAVTYDSLPKETVSFMDWRRVYTNAVTNAKGLKVHYVWEDEMISSIDENGKITFSRQLQKKLEGNGNVYTIRVGAYFEGTDIYAQSETVYYTLKINLSGLSVYFQKTGDQTVKYGPNATFENEAKSDNYGVTITYTYSTSDDAVATVDGKGTVTIQGVGQATITAKAEADGYAPSIVEYVLTVVKADQPLEVKGEQTIIYNPNQTYSYNYTVNGIIVEGVTAAATIVHKDGSSAAELPEVAVDENGNIVVTPKDAGVFVLTVTAAGNDNYNKAVVELEITVFVEQSDAAFVKPGDYTITYNDVNENGDRNIFVNRVDGVLGGGAVTYSSSNNEIATVDTAGNVTVHKSGTVTITCAIASDGTYEAKELTYTLTIEKADQVISFKDGSATSVSNKDGEYAVEMICTENLYATHTSDNEEISFQYSLSIPESTDYLNGVYMKGNTVHFENGNYGTITIKVTREGNGCYESWEGTIEVSIGQKAVNSENFAISGTLSDTGWYITNPVITYTENGVSFNLAVPVAVGERHNPVNWLDTYTMKDGVYEELLLCVSYNFEAGHNVDALASIGKVQVDTEAPYDVFIHYSESVWGKILETVTFGYYHSKVTVTISAKDNTSGVAKIHYNYNGEWMSKEAVDGEISFDIEAQYEGKVSCYAEDNATNKSDEKTGEITIIVDNIVPGINVTWPEAKQEYEGIYYYDGAVVATVVINEKNFFNGEAAENDYNDGSNKDKGVLAYVNGKLVKFDAEQWQLYTDAEGNAVADTWVNTITLKDEGQHTLVIEYTDRSGNEMDTYTSAPIVVDETNPVVSVDPDHSVVRVDASGNINSDYSAYYPADTTLTVKIVERNFRASDVEFVITAMNLAGDAVETEVVYGAWVTDEKNPDVHYITLTFKDEANYTLDVQYKDLALRESNDLAEQHLTVDKNAPEQVEIAYSNDVWGEVLEALSFGYYNANMTVTITASDLTSGVATIYYNYNGKWESAEPDEEGKITFTISKQYRGKVSYYAVDKATNKTDEKTGNVEIIVDDIAPVIEVTWTEAQQVADGNHYYNDKAVATVVITEDNFFNGEAVGRDDNNPDSNKELGVQAFVNGQLVSFESATWTAFTDEQGNEVDGKWVNTIVLDQEGHYNLVIEYTDRSDNKMHTYTAETVTIDHTDPVVSVSPENSAERMYYDDTAEVVVTIVEHNFRADDVIFNIVATDVAGNEVAGEVLYSEWSVDAANPDIHYITLTFQGEANYTLDVEYKDLALRESNDLAQQLLTVDKTAPESLTISYSENLWDTILDAITFGYYDEPVTVTITAVDNTAGIVEFAYEYVLNAGVSSVNKGGSGTVAATQNGNVFTATFQIPASALIATNQFNGYVGFTVVDRSGNTSVKNDKDSNTLVVDNIAPTATISYNAPAQSANGIDYYAGDINATITITEANFFSDDVTVTVTKDGVSYDVDVQWTNNGTDLHIGTFTLTEDGDYIVTVSYQDKSGNKMNTYTSNELTLDTTAPTINASNIVINSANKDDVYTFTVTVDDTNLDASTINAVLQAVIRNQDGTYTVQNIDLGEAVTVVEGQTYTYTVEDLPADGLYTLTCSVKDMSGNGCSDILLDDGKTYETVQFSINRKGSIFLYGDQFTEDLVGQYYVYSVENDVVIVEINVDPIENYSIKLNGTELTEGADFTTTQTSENGQWSKRTYVISKDLFAAEGEYSIVVSSTDKTSTTSFSDVKGLTVAFTVDQTKPDLTISGLENNGRYQTEEQTVTIIPGDEGGRLDSLKVVLLDSDGNPLVDDETGADISLRFEMSGEELRKYLEENDGKVTFTIPVCLNAQVRITCSDCAANAQGQTNEFEETFTRVTVSPNALVIFYANTPLFVGAIAGVLALLAVIIILLKRKKEKK